MPAIALTAYASAADRIRALSMGFQMHISKPVEPAELVVSIVRLSRERV
jgi:CheY-like chemotaxis protein